MAALDPFYRDGRPIPLTATDYASRAGLTFPQAKGVLQRLARIGLVRRSEFGGRTLHHVREAD